MIISMFLNMFCPVHCFAYFCFWGAPVHWMLSVVLRAALPPSRTLMAQQWQEILLSGLIQLVRTVDFRCEESLLSWRFCSFDFRGAHQNLNEEIEIVYEDFLRIVLAVIGSIFCSNPAVCIRVRTRTVPRHATNQTHVKLAKRELFR